VSSIVARPQRLGSYHATGAGTPALEAPQDKQLSRTESELSMSFQALKYYVAMARERGPIYAVCSAWLRLNEKHHERRLGINTAHVMPTSALGFDNPEFHEYAPTKFHDFRLMFKRLGLRKHQDVFLDYGSGMGRVLIMAAQYPLKRVIGVEFVPALNEIATQNIQRLRGRLKCPDIQTFVADATAYVVPPDVTIAYFNNPFHGEVFAGALEQLRRSLEQNPRSLAVVCYFPLPGPSRLVKMIEACDWLTKKTSFDVSEFQSCHIAVSRKNPR